MAEYYAVLKKAVGGLESGSADARRAVYDKARNALISQLKAIDPPLAASEISRQRLELEEAIRRVERETASEGRAPLRPRQESAGAAPNIAPEPQAPPPAPERGDLTPQDLFRQAIEKAETRSTGSSRPAERAPVRGVSRIDERAEEVDLRATRERDERAEQQGEDHKRDPIVGREADIVVPRPPLASESNLSPEPSFDQRDNPIRGSRSTPSDSAEIGDVVAAPAARRSRLPTILLGVLIVGMIGGLGALGWSQRTVISDLLANFDTGGAEDSVQPETVSVAPDDAAPKSGDRVSGETEVEPDAIAEAITDAPDGSSDTLVAQRAVLFEEPLDAAAAAAGVVEIDAVVTWRYVEGGPNGPEIEASLEVPDRGMNVRIVIRRNGDPGLPASHLVETNTETPADFPGKTISNVPRLIMKLSQDERGQPLVGAAAKVADGFFWIALSSAKVDVDRNMTYLRDRSWIDLPLVYETGQRAILTFEKGAAGERIFERALSAWGAG